MKWLVWGTGAGVMPFFLFYAIPFALGREPRQAMELAGYIPLALIPLSLAYAVVKHRLMDVELIFRRTLVYILALAAIVGMCLLAVNLFQVLLASDRSRTSPSSPSSRPWWWPCSSARSRTGSRRASTACSSASATTRGARCCACPRTSTRTSTSGAWRSGCSRACTTRWA